MTISCGSANRNNQIPDQDRKFFTSDFISLTVPTIYTKSIKYHDPADDKIKDVLVTDVKHDNTLLNSLTDISSTVTIYQSDQSGTLSLLGSKATAKNSSYVVIYDFTQTQTILKVAGVSKDSIKESIGVAVRMIANVKTKKRSVNLTDLFKLGIDVQNDNIEGTLAVRSVGISSQKVNQAIPTPTDLSSTSISTALQSVATIKTLIYDSETKITPYLIGIGIPAKSTKEEVENQLSSL